MRWNKIVFLSPKVNKFKEQVGFQDTVIENHSSSGKSPLFLVHNGLMISQLDMKGRVQIWRGYCYKLIHK